MNIQYQLQIIQTDGRVTVYNLNQRKGITQIGSHPDNDIVLKTPGVALFWATLYHWREPCYLLLLPQGSRDGESIVLNQQEQVTLEGKTLGLLKYSQPPVIPPAPPEWAGSGFPSIYNDDAPASSVALQPHPAPEYSPEGPVEVNLLTSEQTVDVEGTATYLLQVINRGSIYADFSISLASETLGGDWLSQESVQLRSGEAREIKVEITPPRRPNSRAGRHDLFIIVTTRSYGGLELVHKVQLTIRPYYSIHLDPLHPKAVRLFWFARAGWYRVSVRNTGNETVNCQLTDGDSGDLDYRLRVFEKRWFGRKVDAFSLSPDWPQANLWLHVRPLSRPLIGWGKKSRKFAVAANSTDHQGETAASPQAQSGLLRYGPIIGPLLWLPLVALILFVVVVYFTRARIYNFSITPAEVKAGQPATINWASSGFSTVRVEPDIGLVANIFDSPDGSHQVKLHGVSPIQYALIVESWPARVLPAFVTARLPQDWLYQAKVARLALSPVMPEILIFTADKQQFLAGDTLTIFWEVVNADNVTLLVNGERQPLRSTEHTHQLVVTPAGDTTYELIAKDESGQTTAATPIVVQRVPATPEPVAASEAGVIEAAFAQMVISDTQVVQMIVPPPEPPEIFSFNVTPNEITAGETVTIDWSVDPEATVSVYPLVGPFFSTGKATDNPQETTQYRLTVSNGQTSPIQIVREVVVQAAPTPTPSPSKPIVEYLEVDKGEIVKGEDEVKLSWSIVGNTTKIELNAGDLGTIPNLDPVAEMTLAPESTTLFVLNAFNEDTSASKTAQVKVIEPEPTEEPEEEPEEGGDEDSDEDEVLKPKTNYFRANITSSNDFRAVGDGVYRIVTSATVTLSWEVDNADTITLVSPDVGETGERPSKGSYDIGEITADKTYELKAENEDGIDKKIIEIDIVPPPPNPPSILNSGEHDADKNLIKWSLNVSDETLNQVSGFRVYRAMIDPAEGTLPYEKVADEKVLGRQKSDWEDTTEPTTCKQYQVEVVYTDALSGRVETSRSKNVWASPCSKDQ